MAGLNWRNMALRILSVALALLLWLYASNEQNPVNDQILSLQLNRINQPEGMEISGIPSSVSIRVQGPRTQVTALNPGEFQAVVDLSKVAEGDNYIPVKVTSPPNVQVIQVTPNRVHVVADSVVQKQVGVAVAFKGTPAKGYITQDPVIQPATVVLKGPRSKVGAIDQVRVTVDVESAAKVVEQTVPVTSGQNGVGVFPQTVKVTVPVTPLPSKTVAVKATATGDPAKDYTVAGFTVNPSSVQVVAPSGDLAGINQVETDKIDVKGADRDVTVKIGVRPPPGAIEVKPAVVDVTVHVKKIESQTTGTQTPAR